MRIFNRYKQNLRVIDNHVISYTTKVGRIDWGNRTLTILGWWSPTTSKHINYAASELNLEIIKL